MCDEALDKKSKVVVTLSTNKNEEFKVVVIKKCVKRPSCNGTRVIKPDGFVTFDLHPASTIA